jgi:CxxC motif-containing protein
MSFETICIVCPNGCHLKVSETAGGLTVTGNKCVRGDAYGRQEAADPRRVVTCVVPTASADWPQAPVKTTGGVPKKMIRALLKDLYGRTAVLPVKRGQKLIENYQDLKIDVVFTRSLPPPTPGGKA